MSNTALANAKPVKSRMQWKDWFDVLIYVIWTISIYVFSYYTLKRADSIDRTYQIWALLFMISCVWLYKIETKELTKEIIKCTLILISTTMFSYFVGGEAVDLDSIKNLLSLVICNIMNAAVGYGIIFYIRKSYVLYGDKTYKLETATLIVTGILMFILNCNVIFSLIVAAIFNILVGYCIYRKNILNSVGVKKHKKYPCSKKKEKRRKRNNKKRRFYA